MPRPKPREIWWCRDVGPVVIVAVMEGDAYKVQDVSTGIVAIVDDVNLTTNRGKKWQNEYR